MVIMSNLYKRIRLKVRTVSRIYANWFSTSHRFPFHSKLPWMQISCSSFQVNRFVHLIVYQCISRMLYISSCCGNFRNSQLANVYMYIKVYIVRGLIVSHKLQNEHSLRDRKSPSRVHREIDYDAILASRKLNT